MEYYTTARRKQPGSPNLLYLAIVEGFLVTGMPFIWLKNYWYSQIHIVVGDQPGVFGSYRDRCICNL